MTSLEEVTFVMIVLTIGMVSYAFFSGWVGQPYYQSCYTCCPTSCCLPTEKECQEKYNYTVEPTPPRTVWKMECWWENTSDCVNSTTWCQNKDRILGVSHIECYGYDANGSVIYAHPEQNPRLNKKIEVAT
jgi:hypothetical protein